ncbi:MAG TPA: GNAT family N-acetyltransferase, partial [Rhodocyclaceae bacterium]|nr:GNAT family N-acetyltransferase [Rhodocyclaceae bacterium]
LLYCRAQAPYRCLSVTNWYASLYSPLVSSAMDRGVALDGLVDRVVARHAGCAAVQLVPLDGAAPETASLERAFTRHGWYVKRYFGFGNWHLPCQGLSFADYMAGRDSQLRHTWTRKAKKFQGSGAEGRLEIVTDSARVEAAMDAYEQVYARSWKEPEAYPGFVRGWARICARNGWLRLGLAWVGEVPVAAQFWFTLHGRAYIFKLAYDEGYSRYSAGTVLTAHLFRHALDEDRVAEIDYLSGDDPYKRGWMDLRRERIGLLACNPCTLRGLLLAAGDLAGEFSRPWRRLIRPRGQAPAASRP